jgi:hypothetical protein
MPSAKYKYEVAQWPRAPGGRPAPSAKCEKYEDEDPRLGFFLE